MNDPRYMFIAALDKMRTRKALNLVGEVGNQVRGFKARIAATGGKL